MPQATQIKRSELRAIFRLLGDVRDLRQDRSAQRARMVEGLCEVLGARQGSVLELDGFSPWGNLKLIDVHHGGWASPLAAAIWEGQLRAGNFACDVLIQRARQMPGDVKAVLRDELVPDEIFYAMPLVRELMPMLEVDSHCIGWCRPEPGRPDLVLGFTFHRDLHDRGFDKPQRELMRIFLEELMLMHRDGKLPALTNGHNSSNGPRLTTREGQVLQRLLLGDSMKQTATALGLSAHTVHDYVKSLYRKYHVSTRAELLARFVRPN
jgi:DNA-binding CsgD family transcriptional regulator